MAKLFVVRHAQVNLDLSIPSSEWTLSEDGVRATTNLAVTECWDGVACIYHSPEPKAVETARIISQVTNIPMKVKNDLRELEIPTIQPRQEFIRRVGAYLRGFHDPEFEDWDMATSRIVRCIESVVQGSAGSSVAVVTHGRILSVLYSHLLKRRITAAEWQSIRLPDLSVINLETWTVERGFLSDVSSQVPVQVFYATGECEE